MKTSMKNSNNFRSEQNSSIPPRGSNFRGLKNKPDLKNRNSWIGPLFENVDGKFYPQRYHYEFDDIIYSRTNRKTQQIPKSKVVPEKIKHPFGKLKREETENNFEKL